MSAAQEGNTTRAEILRRVLVDRGPALAESYELLIGEISGYSDDEIMGAIHMIIRQMVQTPSRDELVRIALTYEGMTRARQLREHDNERQPGWEKIQGGLGFALFSVAAEVEDARRQRGAVKGSGAGNELPASGGVASGAGSGYGPHARYAEFDEEPHLYDADYYLADPWIRAFLLAEYEVFTEALCSPAVLEFHRAGTTSFILSTVLADGEPGALKIVKFQYLDNQLIAAQTEDYANSFGGAVGLDNVPLVRKTGRRYVLMDRVSGMTLREYLNDLKASDDKLALIERVFCGAPEAGIRGLLDILKAYASSRHPIHHYDLSPDNVILEGTQLREVDGRQYSGGSINKIWVIDWGQNYLLTERLGSGSRAAQLQSYVSPELFAGHARGIRTDLYSLGCIILEMASGERLQPTNKTRAIDHVWMSFPDIAEIVENLIDENPLNRMLGSTPSQEWGLFDEVAAQLSTARQVLRQQAEMSATGIAASLKAMDRVLSAATGLSLTLFLEAWQRVEGLSDTEDRATARYLVGWMVLASVVDIVTLAIIAVFTYRDFQNGQLLENLPSRLICFTFVVVASSYYLNVFATLSVWGLSKPTEIAMRVNAFSFAPPILYATVVDTNAWPVCSAIGIGFVVLNNLLTYRLARRGIDEAAAQFRLPESTTPEDFLDQYSRWWSLMMWYGLALLVVGVGLSQGWARDELLYASLAVVVNIKMLTVNDWKTGPRMKAGMARAFYGLTRARVAAAAARPPS